MAADSSIILAPLLDASTLAALAAPLAGLAVYGLWRRARGAWLRLGFAAAALAVLLQPVRLVHERQVQPDIAVMLVDESQSQAEAGRLAQTQRAADALMAATAADTTLEWRVVRVQSDAQGNDTATALFTALADALHDEPRGRLAGVVLITDGLAHDSERQAALGDLEAPVHAILTGDPAMRDRQLVIAQTPRFGVVGRPLAISVRVDDGDGAHGDVPLEWSYDDNAPQRRLVKVGEDVTVMVTPRHAGANTVRLRVPALAGETILFNNEALLSINGVRDRLRVLLITGEPYPGERAWRDTLKADPAVDLVHFTIL
ncbi:MAG: hypothetical protein D6782_06120, partial [Alphaproteobacteria bacterium]